MKHSLVVVSGPSGVGKGTIVKTLVKRREDVVESVSCTTRAPREGERHGREYFFLSKEEFLKRVDEGDFLEYDEHFGNYYGTPKDFVMKSLQEKDVLLEIDVNGGLAVERSYPDAILIMVLPPNKEEIRKRLIGRSTETIEKINLRMERIEYELAKSDDYDYAVVNDDLMQAVNEIEQIILKEKNKV